MELSTLTNSEIVAGLKTLTGNEREVLVKILFHLIELENRKAYREFGYSCLFEYCVGALKYSRGAAGRRTRAAEVLRSNPEVEALLLSGELTLSAVVAAAEVIKTQEVAVSEITSKSAREVELLIAHTCPKASKSREKVKPVVIEAQEIKEERYEIKFSVSKETFQKLEEAKKLLSHSLGADMSVEKLIEALLEKTLKPVAKKERRNLRTRVVPASVKQAVVKRDNCQCTYRSPDGRRCTETHYLELDHIVPFAAGGLTTEENLRLLFPAHNQLAAEEYFGKAFMDKKVSANYFQR